jgi:hypothetical protein
LEICGLHVELEVVVEDIGEEVEITEQILEVGREVYLQLKSCNILMDIVLDL